MAIYIITGVSKNRKRFSPILTNNPHHYNIWRGTLWRKDLQGKRNKIKVYYN